MSHLLFERDIRFLEILNLSVFFTLLYSVLTGRYGFVSTGYSDMAIRGVLDEKCFSSNCVSTPKNVKNKLSLTKDKKWESLEIISHMRNIYTCHNNKEGPAHHNSMVN